MKLYYLPGACSTASMISLIEAGQKFEAYSVDGATKRTSDGKDFNQINPKGYVPALILDDGSVLTENVALLAYIASLDKSGKLGPAPGSVGCYRLLEWLAYIGSEIHKNFGALFNPALDEAGRTQAKAALAKRLGFIEKKLGNQPFLMGNEFTVADAYLYVTLSWRDHVGVDISTFPALVAFSQRAGSRPSVAESYKIQGMA
jgi:glutathione S-transferase